VAALLSAPAWPLGLTVGIWPVVVLGRRDVMLATCELPKYGGIVRIRVGPMEAYILTA
jgi:hypothetical protein